MKPAYCGNFGKVLSLPWVGSNLDDDEQDSQSSRIFHNDFIIVMEVKRK